QRLSAIALVPLGLCFAVVLVRLATADHATVIAAFSSPLVALVAASTVIVGFWHLKLGLQVVIEDYVHDRAWEVLLQITQIFFCWVLGGLGVLAVLRLHLGM
ncbi:MAG: succinate dehydrogenase, hydrophobic membrane anchor protein, partial [Alphaproteobacteria bacterium]|nr:succinate dehydrogenase, hydrophobic membrane anchor protein [Alphaproteobacteria bacterium]